MKQNAKIDRAHVSRENVSVSELPKSGFDLSYRSYQDFVLGRLHVAGYQHIMPADKFRGSNTLDSTLNPLVPTTPMMSPVNVSLHNFYVTNRSVDTSFEDALAPSKLNGMSATWHTPCFTLKDIIAWIISFYNGVNKDAIFPPSKFDTMTDAFNALFAEDSSDLMSTVTDYASIISDLTHYVTLDPDWMTSARTAAFTDMYMLDYLEDIREYATARVSGIDGNSTVFEARYAFVSALLNPWIGENSLLDTFGYNYLRDYDIRQIVDNNSDFWKQIILDGGSYPDNITALTDYTDDISQCEYAIRHYYQIWYEYYRDVNLEPKSANLPSWKSFGSTPLIGSSSPFKYLLMLLVRIRSWNEDMFIQSQPDDMSRHVFAPILSEPNDVVEFTDVDNEGNYSSFFNAESNSTVFNGPNRNLSVQTLGWLEPSTGQFQTLNCPVPSNVNDSIRALTTSSSFSVLGLDLYNLKFAQMLERYLKRNFYFGDMYKDRMLAHYGVRVSDMRVNRPEFLSAGLGSVGTNQEIANISTIETTVGDRTATATAGASGDGFQFFAEEFGMVITLASFIPQAQYAGLCPQNIIYKETDYPKPEFANNNEEFGRVLEIATSGLIKNSVETKGMFGHYPYAHAWRGRVDEVHGSFLSSKQNWVFRRYFGMDTPDKAPKLNYIFLHCRPNIGMFQDAVRLNPQVYGSVVHNFYVERVLPVPVETI